MVTCFLKATATLHKHDKQFLVLVDNNRYISSYVRKGKRLEALLNVKIKNLHAPR